MSDTNSFSATMYMYMYKGMTNNVADFAGVVGSSPTRGSSLTLGAHAQRGLQYLVCVSVCLSVYDYSRTTGYEAAYERYQ